MKFEKEWMVLSGVQEISTPNGSVRRVPGTGKILGSYMRYQDAVGCVTRHKKKHSHARGIYIDRIRNPQ